MVSRRNGFYGVSAMAIQDLQLLYTVWYEIIKEEFW